MKTEKNILIAFILNLAFSVFEIVGGVLTGSVAIISDAVHDIGDALSIGIAFFLEKKSKKLPDEEYTYGYAGFSVIGSVITNLLLSLGSVAVIFNAVLRIFNPTEIHYDGMIVFAIIGACVNLGAAFATRGGVSLNQKAVNLHMLEDVLGWIVVLIGAVVMRFTAISILDPLLSMGVAFFILVSAVKNLAEAFTLFLKKVPHGIRVAEIKEHLCEIDGVLDVHHVHVWSIDGYHHYATLHVVTRGVPCDIKEAIRQELHEHGINHITVELESEGEYCCEQQCRTSLASAGHHHHHH